MAKNKKKRKLERAQKRQDWAFLIGEKITEKETKNPIPEEVSIIKEEDDSKKYLISFINYLDNECEIEKMISSGDRDLGYALKILKIVSNQCTHYHQLQQKSFIIKSVSNDNQYANLYRGLKNKSVDTRGLTIYEAYIKTKKDGRMFFWSDEPNKIIYVIAVRKNHYK